MLTHDRAVTALGHGWPGSPFVLSGADLTWLDATKPKPSDIEIEAAWLALNAPLHEAIVCPWSAAHPRHDHQLIFPLDDERLMLVWSEYYGNASTNLDRQPTDTTNQAADESPCRISAMISRDVGRSWSGTMTLQENLWALNVKHPNLIRVSPTELIFTCTGWDSMAQRNVYAKRSTDNGETWGPLAQITEPGWYCNTADRALRLSSGRILLPTHGAWSGTEDYIGQAPFAPGVKLWNFMLYSDDGGQEWSRGQGVTAPGRGAHEGTIVELTDGRLLQFLRNTNEEIYRTVSQDGGETWSEPVGTGLAAPESPALLKRLPSGDILLLWNNVPSPINWPRSPLTAAVTRDEGESWSGLWNIDDRANHDAAYASATFVGDEALIAYYTRPTFWSRDTEIMLRVYSLSHFDR